MKFHLFQYKRWFLPNFELKDVPDSPFTPCIGNLIFFLGKTTTILAAARDLFGDIWRSRILELNASDERGIAVVRDKIKGFSQQSVSNSGSKVPPFKIIILDEADRFVYFFYLGAVPCPMSPRKGGGGEG